MLNFKRRCLIADEQGSKHEFRVVNVLSGGELVLLAPEDADRVRFLAAAGNPLAVLAYLSDHVVGLEPETGRFLTSAELKTALEGAASPLLRLVGIAA